MHCCMKNGAFPATLNELPAADHHHGDDGSRLDGIEEGMKGRYWNGKRKE